MMSEAIKTGAHCSDCCIDLLKNKAITAKSIIEEEKNLKILRIPEVEFRRREMKGFKGF